MFLAFVIFQNISNHLEQQATKLLQLKKATLNDIEIIQDICWM